MFQDILDNPPKIAETLSLSSHIRTRQLEIEAGNQNPDLGIFSVLNVTVLHNHEFPIVVWGNDRSELLVHGKRGRVSSRTCRISKCVKTLQEEQNDIEKVEKMLTLDGIYEAIYDAR